MRAPTYAIFQKTLEIPPVDRLKRAFKSVRFLTPADAHTIANDAYGILLKNLSLEDASILQQSLAHEGVETEIVLESEVVVLPPAKHIRRLQCTPEALMIFDPLNRSFPLEWRYIQLIAAGNVRSTDFGRHSAEFSTQLDPMGFRGLFPAPHFEPPQPIKQFLLEIILQRAVLRYCLKADRLALNQCLGESGSMDDAQKFILLVQEICRHAPHTATNRGALHLRDGMPEVLAYPTKNAFQEEIVWLLCRLNRPRADQ